MSAKDNISCCCLTASFQQTPAVRIQLSLLSLPAKLQMLPPLPLKMGSIFHTAELFLFGGILFLVFPGFDLSRGYTIPCWFIILLAKFRKWPLEKNAASVLLFVCSLTLKKTNFWSITTCFRNGTATKIHQKSKRHFSGPRKKNYRFQGSQWTQGRRLEPYSLCAIINLSERNFPTQNSPLQFTTQEGCEGIFFPLNHVPLHIQLIKSLLLWDPFNVQRALQNACE